MNDPLKIWLIVWVYFCDSKVIWNLGIVWFFFWIWEFSGEFGLEETKNSA